MKSLRSMKKMVNLLAVGFALVCGFSAAVAAAEAITPADEVTTEDSRIFTSIEANSFITFRLMTMPVTARLVVPEGVVTDLSGRLITFTLGCVTGGSGNGTCTPVVATALTDSLGIAKATVTIALPEGLQPYIVSFAGDETLLPSQFIGYVGVNKR